jgi:hypothetical protein
VIRSYREMRRLETFEERFKYLSLQGRVGFETFGSDRYLNQGFYTSREWRQLRQKVILRDNACDLGVDGYELHERIIIHHMNPVTKDEIIHGDQDLMNPDFLISVSHKTHNAIHYGDKSQLPRVLVARSPGDTRLW